MGWGWGWGFWITFQNDNAPFQLTENEIGASRFAKNGDMFSTRSSTNREILKHDIYVQSSALNHGIFAICLLFVQFCTQ